MIAAECFAWSVVSLLVACVAACCWVVQRITRRLDTRHWKRTTATAPDRADVQDVIAEAEAITREVASNGEER